MKLWILFIASAWVCAAGCQSVSPPAPGTSAIRVHVVAEAKAGYVSPADRPELYDSPRGRDLGSGAFQRVDYAGLDEIVVWLEPVNGSTGRAPDAPASVDVAANAAATKVARAASVGQALVIHNVGPRAANFYSVSDGNDFDLGSIPPGGQKTYTVRSAGLIEILSDVSAEPVAEVYGAPSRWVALAQSGRAVDFTNLPPGRYVVASWHPRLPGNRTPVTLLPDQIGTATVKVGVNALPKVGRVAPGQITS